MFDQLDKIKEVTPKRRFSDDDFRVFGVEQIAYIRPNPDDGNSYNIYSASGQLIGHEKSFDRAVFTARQNQLEPVTVH